MSAAEKLELLREGGMDVKAAAKFTGWGRTRLFEAMAEGRLPYTTNGAKRIIPVVSLKKLMAEDLVIAGA